MRSRHGSLLLSCKELLCKFCSSGKAVHLHASFMAYSWQLGIQISLISFECFNMAFLREQRALLYAWTGTSACVNFWPLRLSTGFDLTRYSSDFVMIRWRPFLPSAQLSINPADQFLMIRQVYKSRITVHSEGSLFAAKAYMLFYIHEGSNEVE